MDVHKLVGIVAVAIESLPESLREKSFIRDWIKIIYDKVKTGDTKYMRTNEDSYYDAMPTVRNGCGGSGMMASC
eukprot:5493523-Ditylum_brightwellii.AAC.1